MKTVQQTNKSILIPRSKYTAEYIYYLLQTIPKYLLSFSGDTATPILNKGDFGKVITFAHVEQKDRDQIATLLSEIDNKIEIEQQTKSELEKLKKGLMQKLLTGKMRVSA